MSSIEFLFNFLAYLPTAPKIRATSYVMQLVVKVLKGSGSGRFSDLLSYQKKKKSASLPA